uniref:thiopeptide-type bacteriocin biosynthesis protein n=1 Tax=Paractinoplanes polyasparticus TaxID=2856853 RepID=UPI001C85C7CF|nr:thiopeptide-type bacteriocin biosynthesis protein [Actinoplanes polyasparticus]
MNSIAWQQANLEFTDPDLAEQVAVTHVTPVLTAAEDNRLIIAWFIVRKGHQWRLRYLPAHTSGNPATGIRDLLEGLQRCEYLTTVTYVIYEPETTAFGGTRAMRLAHRLWHLDSRHLLAPPAAHPQHTRELSMMLCSAMMRAAGLDWYEQGDVWSRVADHRDPADPSHIDALRDAVRHLLIVDPNSLTHADAALAGESALFDAFTSTGAALRRTHESGQLCRGLREVLTHHVIFMWNRRGVPEHDQTALAAAAGNIIFGPHSALTGSAAA